MCNEKKQSPPVDRGNVVGLIILILGMGILLPWNFFITATQYFNTRLSENCSSNSTSLSVSKYNYDSWVSLLSKLPLLLFSLLNSCFYQPMKACSVRQHYRVVFSLVSTLLLFGLTAALVQVDMDPDSFFSVTMATVWFINMFGADIQGSLFALVGLFPHHYNTLFMSGQSLSGIFANVAMLLSILSNSDSRSGILGYFITPCVVTFITLLCFLLLPHLNFAHFYMNQSSNYEPETSKELLRDSEMKILSHCLRTKELLGREEEDRLSAFKVFKKIWPMTLYVTCIFSVTLCIFPAVTVRVQTVYVENQAWANVFTCICCFMVFNVMDMAGRSTLSLLQWPSKDSRLLPALVVSRVAFVPLLMMCNIPNSKLWVLFSHDAAFLLLMALFSFSHGYLATLCMAYAPKLVHIKDAMTAGSLMFTFLALGLAVGAALSFPLCALV